MRFDTVIVSDPLLITVEEFLESPGIYYFLKNPGNVLELMKQISWKIIKRVLGNSGKSWIFSYFFSMATL